MSTRNPDRYEVEALDTITGPVGSRVRLLPLGDVAYNYEGTLRARLLSPDRVLDTVVIDLERVGGREAEGAPVRTSFRYAALEGIQILPTPEETPS